MITILNPAPAINRMRRELLQYVDFICPNQNEALTIAGMSISGGAGVDGGAGVVGGAGVDGAGVDGTVAAADELITQMKSVLEWFLAEAGKLGNSSLVSLILICLH